MAHLQILSLRHFQRILGFIVSTHGFQIIQLSLKKKLLCLKDFKGFGCS